MSRSYADDPVNSRQRADERSAPDEIAHSHTERLLRDARNATLFHHRMRMLDIEAQHRLRQYHSHFDRNQPRVPAGHSDGGQWTSAGGGQSGSEPQTLSDATPDNDWKPGAQYANRRGRGSGPIRNGEQWSEPEPGQLIRLDFAKARANDAIARVQEIDPSWQPQRSVSNSIEAQISEYEVIAEQARARLRELELPPIIPKSKPSSSKERNDIAREVAGWLLRNRGNIIERAKWLDESEAAIDAYLDPPKTLEELQRAAAEGGKKGYQIHHIVEQKSAEDDKFPRSMIDAPDNLVRIPTYKHWEINGWYGRQNEAFGKQSPREYLRNKDWNERLRVGLDALREHGVLKR